MRFSAAVTLLASATSVAAGPIHARGLPFRLGMWGGNHGSRMWGGNHGNRNAGARNAGAPCPDKPETKTVTETITGPNNPRTSDADAQTSPFMNPETEAQQQGDPFAMPDGLEGPEPQVPGPQTEMPGFPPRRGGSEPISQREPTRGPPMSTPSPEVPGPENEGGNMKAPSNNGNVPNVSGGSITEVALSRHNAHRSNHSASALEWSSELEQSAGILAQSCSRNHDTSINGGGYGQNIATFGHSNLGSISKEDFLSNVVTEMWYNGEFPLLPPDIFSVDTPDMSNSMAWGHLSQIIWKETSSLGCAVHRCAGNLPFYFAVCNYKTPGNVQGSYAKNMGAPLGRASLHGANI